MVISEDNRSKRIADLGVVSVDLLMFFKIRSIVSVDDFLTFFNPGIINKYLSVISDDNMKKIVCEMIGLYSYIDLLMNTDKKRITVRSLSCEGIINTLGLTGVEKDFFLRHEIDGVKLLKLHRIYGSLWNASIFDDSSYVDYVSLSIKINTLVNNLLIDNVIDFNKAKSRIKTKKQ